MIPFEDLRPLSKLPEFLSMGKPVILPNVNIASLFKDGSDALLLKVSDPEEIAQACINFFQNKDLAEQLGINARVFAQIQFNLESQVQKLVNAYQEAITSFDVRQSKQVWDHVINQGFAAGALLKIELEQIRFPEKSAAFLKQVIEWDKHSIKRVNSLSTRIETLERRLTSSNLRRPLHSGSMLHGFLRRITSFIR